MAKKPKSAPADPAVDQRKLELALKKATAMAAALKRTIETLDLACQVIDQMGPQPGDFEGLRKNLADKMTSLKAVKL